MNFAYRCAGKHVFGWFVVGLLFNLLVLLMDGSHAAMVWFDGYILEYAANPSNCFYVFVVWVSFLFRALP